MKNYELVYNGSSWDIKTDNTIFKKQEIVFGETIFNNQKQFTCFIIGLLKNNSDLKIIPIKATNITLVNNKDFSNLVQSLNIVNLLIFSHLNPFNKTIYIYK